MAVYVRGSSSHSDTAENNSCAQLEPTPALHTPETPEPAFSKGFLCPPEWAAAEWHWVCQLSTSKEEIRSHSSIGGILSVYLKGKCSSSRAEKRNRDYMVMCQPIKREEGEKKGRT